MHPTSHHISPRGHPNAYPDQGQTTQYTLVQEYNGNNDSPYDPWLQREPNPFQPQPNHKSHSTGSTTEIPLTDGGHYQKRTRSTRQKISAWALELIAITTSVAALVAIVAILHREDDKPLAAWSLKVSLNTVISTLGTVSRTSLAFALSACIGQQKWNWLGKRPARLIAFQKFDEASRGPWGATLLLIWLRLKHWAAIGAVVTIATVAFDPFLQAVISTDGRLDTIILSNDNAIGQALKVDGGEIVEFSASGVNFITTEAGVMVRIPIKTRPDFGMISSVYRGFYNGTGSNQAVRFNCSTGNCTWTNFVSTAVCSTCNDVSSQTQMSSAIGRNASNVPSLPNVSINATYTMFRLPYSNIRNINAYSNFLGQVSFDSQHLVSPRTYMTANMTYDVYETITFQKYETLLMAFTMMRASKDYLENKTSWEKTTPTATECALYLCAKEFKSWTNNSVLEEKVVNSWATRDPNSFKHDKNSSRFDFGTNASAWVEAQGNRFYNPTIDPPRTNLRLTIPPTATTKLNNVSDLYVTQRFIRSTIEFLLEFTGAKALKQDEVLAFPQPSGTPFIDALWSSNNLSGTFDNAARSLTNQLRDVAQQRHQGTAQSWTIHVKVNWPYLSYTIAMLTFGVLYVLLTIFETTRLSLPVWKESLLPSLLYGFDDETQSLLRRADEGGKMSHDGLIKSKDDVLVALKYDEKAGCTRLAVI
ncbi:hypothetical protein GQ44DRAFT_828730 [Phaeosphaeriaceae sp. PMI808]|nr:hypothetical protein GQ44DRAFT_828730 [Phaeosphaeriaceae sp. PMI808]